MEDIDNSHTLNARAYYFPVERDKRLSSVSKNLLNLPSEIRDKIYDLTFGGSRVAVCSDGGCYCASDGTGPYHEDHRWLLTEIQGPVRQEAQKAFIMRAMWEIHCEGASKLFLARLERLGSLTAVRYIRLNVFEARSLEYWHPLLKRLRNLKTVTFAPWQKCWSIAVPAKDGSEMLSDASVMEKVRDAMLHRPEYEPVRDLIATQREYSICFVFPIQYLLPTSTIHHQWQLKNWRANMDSGVIDREWSEVYLVQEATLD